MSATVMTPSSEGPAEPSSHDPAETFCRYLARQFVAKKGFSVGTVPEADRLIASSDIVLTQNHSAPFTILCLIDHEANPDRTFDLPLQELEAIARDCMKYVAADPLGLRKLATPGELSVAVRVIEVGPTSDARWEQLKTLTSAPDTKCHAAALAVDTAKGEVRWSSRLDRPERTFIEDLLRAQREPETNTGPFITMPVGTTPVLTLAMIAALALIFLAELIFAIEPPTKPLEPSVKTLFAFGGLQYQLTIERGQWWRLFTGPLLHANFSHIALNCVALFFAGAVLERAVGKSWLAAIFVIGALGGACGSLLINPHDMVSVGASGGIMALFAAMVVLSFRYTLPEVRAKLRNRAIGVLVPSLLPLASASKSLKVDYAAHVGGAIAGATTAYVLLRLWQNTDALPGHRRMAMAVIALGLLGALAGAVAVPLKFGFWTAVAQLIPPEQVPKKDSDINESSARRLLETYPKDPRSHFYSAIVLIQNRDPQGAERELRATLADRFVMEEVLVPSFNFYVQGLLALVLSDEQRPDEARQVAAPVCQGRSSPIFEKLQAAGLCTNSQR